MNSYTFQPANAIPFDSSNPDHRKVYLGFLKNGKWSMTFKLEFPFTNIVSLVVHKLATEACKNDHDLAA